MYKVKEFRNVPEAGEYLGYWRMYFRDGWNGRWFGESGDTSIDGRYAEGLTSQEVREVNIVAKFISEKWPMGCNIQMIRDLGKYNAMVTENRHLLSSNGVDVNLIVLFDTTYGNGDYPVRIYVYRKKVS